MNVQAATAVFIGPFDRRYASLYNHFAPLLSSPQSKYSVFGRPIRLVRLDTSQHERMTEVIEREIARACLVVANITPTERAGCLTWRPNVFYELGYAARFAAPTFRFCDSRFRNQADQLPFDIRTVPVNWYQPSNGWAKLCEDFEAWYQEDRVRASHAAHAFANAAEDIYRAIAQWPAAGSQQFHFILAELTRAIASNVATATSYFTHANRSALVLPDACEVLDGFLAAMLSTLNSNDEYLTFSTVPFLRALARHSRRFHEEFLRATEHRGITARRVVLIGRNEELDDEALSILDYHDGLSRNTPHYKIRYAESTTSEGYCDWRHCGLYVWHRENDERAVLFRPSYQIHEGRAVPIGVEYDGHAAVHRNAFEASWARASKLRFREFLQRRRAPGIH